MSVKMGENYDPFLLLSHPNKSQSLSLCKRERERERESEKKTENNKEL